MSGAKEAIMYMYAIQRRVREFQDSHALEYELSEMPHSVLAGVEQGLEHICSYTPNGDERELSRRVGEAFYHLIRFANQHDIKLDYALGHFLVAYTDQLRGRKQNQTHAVE